MGPSRLRYGRFVGFGPPDANRTQTGSNGANEHQLRVNNRQRAARRLPTLCRSGSHPGTGLADPLLVPVLERPGTVCRDFGPCMACAGSGPVWARGRPMQGGDAHSGAKGDPEDDYQGSQDLSRGLRNPNSQQEASPSQDFGARCLPDAHAHPCGPMNGYTGSRLPYFSRTSPNPSPIHRSLWVHTNQPLACP